MKIKARANRGDAAEGEAGAKTIAVPRVVFALGDREQFTQGGVTREVRPLYLEGRRIGEIDPDYAARVMDALEKGMR